MKPFDLERALAGDPVITRGGEEVDEIFFSEKSGVHHPVLAHIKGHFGFKAFYKDGRHCGEQVREGKYDLFMAPKITRMWINIYRDCHGNYYSGHPINTTEEAEEIASRNKRKMVKTVLVEIEE